MELGIAALEAARTGKVLEQRRVAAPEAVEDSTAAVGDLIGAAIGSFGAAALRQLLLFGADSKIG